VTTITSHFQYARLSNPNARAQRYSRTSESHESFSQYRPAVV
jgi:hypothetical protein